MVDSRTELEHLSWWTVGRPILSPTSGSPKLPNAKRMTLPRCRDWPKSARFSLKVWTARPP